MNIKKYIVWEKGEELQRIKALNVVNLILGITLLLSLAFNPTLYLSLLFSWNILQTIAAIKKSKDLNRSSQDENSS